MSEDLKIIAGLSGPYKGKRIKVKKTTISVGTNRKCDITIKGEYVSDLHAIIKKREDNVWIVQNNSVNGTLVNGERADLKVLVEGDRIQVGSESLFEVSFDAAKKKAPKAEGEQGDSGSKRPLIIAGVGVYLLLMVGVVLFLMSKDDAAVPSAINHADMAPLIENTTAFLMSPGPVMSPGDRRLAARQFGAMSTDYYKLQSLVAEKGSAAEIERMSQEIISGIEKALFRAWQFEQRLQYELALAELEKVFSFVPDVRSPSAEYALQKISEIKARSSDE